MKARKHLTPGRPLPKTLLTPHPPEKAKPVLADHCLANSRTVSMPQTDFTPSHSAASDAVTAIVQDDPMEESKQFTPHARVARGRRLVASTVQPRQLKPTSSVEKESEIASLSTLAQEMKQLFQCMPKVPRKTHRKMSYSMEYAQGTTVKTPKRQSKAASRSFFLEAAAVYQDTPRSTRTRRRSAAHRTVPQSTTRPAKSSDPVDYPTKVAKMEHFFLEFHKKSRDLLGQLERKVLGQL